MKCALNAIALPAPEPGVIAAGDPAQLLQPLMLFLALTPRRRINDRRATSTTRLAERLAADTPLQRVGGVEVVAEAVLHFIRNDFLTGEIQRLNGGAHLR